MEVAVTLSQFFHSGLFIFSYLASICIALYPLYQPSFLLAQQNLDLKCFVNMLRIWFEISPGTSLPHSHLYVQQMGNVFAPAMSLEKASGVKEACRYWRGTVDLPYVRLGWILHWQSWVLFQQPHWALWHLYDLLILEHHNVLWLKVCE